MPFKRLSRRTFLTASSALALLHTPSARVLPVRQIANINDYDPHDWITSSKQVFSEGQTVVVPAGFVCENISTGVFIPPGKTLYILGSLRGNGRGRFALQDDSQVTKGKDGRMHSITLDMRDSDCIIKGLAMSDFGLVTQIYIGDKNRRVMRNLIIDNLTVSHANYVILRQGFHNQIISANITNCKFGDLQGDATKWNVIIDDRDILISDHVIECISYTNGKINWGIGIRLAGSTCDNDYPENQAVKNFVVTNITGSDCRQLIHVEDSRHFVIRSVKARNITPDFSKKAGIDNATAAIYGYNNFVIDNIEIINSVGMLIGYGVIKGKYRSIPQNSRVNDIQLDNTHLACKLRGIQISAGNVASFVALTNIEMKRASLELRNKPQHLFIRNINVIQKSSVGSALSINSDTRKDVRGVFMAKKETLLFLANVHAVNEKGQISVGIDRINHHIVNMEKINFRLPEWGEQICNHSWRNGAILRNNATAIHNEAA